MKPINLWLSTIPARWDDDWDGELLWYQKLYEHHGDRLAIWAGDLATLQEEESGEPGELRFGVYVSLHTGMGEFDRDWNRHGTPQTRYADHGLTVQFWRWGVCLSWRGRRAK